MKIEVSQLVFEYPNRSFRLHLPELRVASGEAVAFVGPSGSGKTTLLRLLAGIYRPSSGEVALDSVELSRLNDAARRELRIARIGFVFQDFRLIEYLNVEENIRLPFRIHRAMRWDGAAEKRLDRLVSAAGIEGKRKSRVDQLSHGEKQRVAICRALVTGPRLVLADEPTGNLDPASKRRVLDLLFERTREQGATLIMVTHDHDLLSRFERVVDFQQFQTGVAG